MLLNQETLRLVFGLKLKSLRSDRGLSLKDLSKKTGLSPSYLNEIEKGKKYPKTEKVLLLADALNEKIEDLISLELKKEFKLIQHLIDKKFLTGIPFDIFGIPSQTVFELLANHPKKMQALVGTFVEIARAHQIEVDDLMFAFLRSYLDMHKNYFSSLETKANQTREHYQIQWDTPPKELIDKVLDVLKVHYKIQINLDVDFQKLLSVESPLEYFVLDQGNSLFLSHTLSPKEILYILSRELGYRVLKSKTRFQTSLTQQMDSFEQLFNHFSASYFAGSILIPEKEITKSLKSLFSQKQWSSEELIKQIEKFNCTVETFFHRMTQVLPQFFGMDQLFYLRYEYDLKTKKYQISKELHLSSLHSPHKVKAYEHYCSRWLIHQLTLKHFNSKDDLIQSSQIGIQRSTYVGTKNEYLVLASSFPNQNNTNKISSVCLGLLINSKVEEKVGFLHDSKIPRFLVGETCERCSISDCTDRKAELDPELNPNRYEQVLKRISELDKN